MAVIQNEKFTLGIVNNDGSPKIGSLVELKAGASTYAMTELGFGKYVVNSIPTGKYNVWVDSVFTGETTPVGSGQVSALGNELDAILVGTADNWTLNTPEELKTLLGLDNVANILLPDPTGQDGKILGVKDDEYFLQEVPEVQNLSNLISVSSMTEFKDALAGTTPSIIFVTDLISSGAIETFQVNSSHIVIGQKIVLQNSSIWNGSLGGVDFYNIFSAFNPPVDCSISGDVAILRFTNIEVTEGLFSFSGSGSMVYENAGEVVISGASKQYWKNSNKTELGSIIQVSDEIDFQKALQIKEENKLIFATDEISIPSSPYNFVNVWGSNNIIGTEFFIFAGSASDSISFTKSPSFGSLAEINFFCSQLVFGGVSTLEIDEVIVKARGAVASNATSNTLTINQLGISPVRFKFELAVSGSFVGDFENIYWDNTNQEQGLPANLAVVSNESEFRTAIEDSSIETLLLSTNFGIGGSVYNVASTSGKKVILDTGFQLGTSGSSTNFNCSGASLEVLAPFVASSFTASVHTLNCNAGGLSFRRIAVPAPNSINTTGAGSIRYEDVVEVLGAEPLTDGTITGTAIQSFWNNTNRGGSTIGPATPILRTAKNFQLNDCSNASGLTTNQIIFNYYNPPTGGKFNKVKLFSGTLYGAGSNGEVAIGKLNGSNIDVLGYGSLVNVSGEQTINLNTEVEFSAEDELYLIHHLSVSGGTDGLFSFAPASTLSNGSFRVFRQVAYNGSNNPSQVSSYSLASTANAVSGRIPYMEFEQ